MQLKEVVHRVQAVKAHEAEVGAELLELRPRRGTLGEKVGSV